MILYGNVQLLGKVIKHWRDSEGIEHTSHFANVMQNNGEIIEKLRLSQEQFNKVEAGKVYTLWTEYGTGKNGGYLKILDIVETSSK